MKKLSNRKAKQLSKPWITIGNKATVKVKNKSYVTKEVRSWLLFFGKYLLHLSN